MLDAADDQLEALYRNAPQSGEFGKLRKRIVRETREAIEAYSMLPPRRGETLLRGKTPLGRAMRYSPMLRPVLRSLCIMIICSRR